MAVPAAYQDCPNLQKNISGHFLEGNIGQSQDALGYLQFIESPLNTNGVLQREVSRGNGKIAKVGLTHQPRGLDADVTDSAIQSCAGGTKEGNLEEIYEIDTTDGKSIAWSITPSELRKSCENDASWFARQTVRHMDTLMRVIDKDILTNAALNFGKFSTTSFDHTTGVASLWAGQNLIPATLSTRKSNGDYDPRFLTQIRSDFAHMNLNGTPILIGDNLLSAFITEADAACCAASGLDLSEIAKLKPAGFIRDENVEGALGVAEFIGISPGAVQLLSYLEFEGDNAVFDGTYSQRTLSHPESGMMFDYLQKFDCGDWHFQLKKAYKPVYQPANLYQATDKLSGVNGMNNFKVVNP